MDDVTMNKYLRQRKLLDRAFNILLALFALFVILHFTVGGKVIKVIMIVIPFWLFGIRHYLMYNPIPRR